MSKSFSWYLNDVHESRRFFLTSNENSKFIFVGKSKDCDIKLNYLKDVSLHKPSYLNSNKICECSTRFKDIANIEDEHALLFYDNCDNKLQLKDLASVHGVNVFFFQQKKSSY